MPDVFTFTHRDGMSAVGTRETDDGSALLLAVRGADCDCIADTLTARWEKSDGALGSRLDALLTQAGDGQAAVAALAFEKDKAAWRCSEGAAIFRFREAARLTAPEQQSAVKEGDAFLLCTGNAASLLREEEILIERLKAENARQWAELLLLRIMERLQKIPEGLCLLTVRF